MTAARTVHHGTIEMERTYRASPSRVFAAWADAKARENWGRPNDEEIIVYDKTDFSVGGEDVSRCGPRGDLRWTARVRYLEIISDARIVMSEHVSGDGVSKAAALITVEIEPAGKGAKLSLSLQIAAFDTPDMLDGYRMGWTGALDNLVPHLEQAN